MSNFTFKKASREAVGLLLGLSGSSGSGKTYSALRLASGMSGGKPFAFIDSESRRGLHYADQFAFDHGELRAPFSPDAYAEAIKAADAAGYPVIVVDSFSHEWAGEGGVLDWAEQELDRMAGQDWKKREACKMASWIKPKMAHKKMMQQLLQARAHIILCFRAEPKIEMIREDGKTKIVPKQSLTGLDGWIPICEKNAPFELTASFMLTADKPGIPQPIKLQKQHVEMIDLKQPLDEKAGQRMADWARGGTKRQPPQAPLAEPQAEPIGEAPDPLSALTFALDQCESIAEMKETWAAYEPTLPKDKLLDAQQAYKARLAVLKASGAQ